MITKCQVPDGHLIIGEADEIKAIYRSMYKAWANDKYSITPMYRNFPIFKDGRLYAIHIFEEDSYAWQDRYVDVWFRVINSEAIARMLIHNIDSTRLE